MMNRQYNQFDDLLAPPWEGNPSMRINKLQVFFILTLLGFIGTSLYYGLIYLPSHMSHKPDMLASAPTAKEAFQSEDDLTQEVYGLAALAGALDAKSGPKDKPSGIDTSLGRPDPFEPLLIPPPDADSSGGGIVPDATVGSDEPPPPPPPPRDPLDDIQYVGMIDENSGSNTVAIFKLSDPIMGNQTVVKKRKEMFLLDGHKCYIKAINRFSVDFQIDGKVRSKALSPFVDGGGGATGGSAPHFGSGVSGQEKQILKGLEG